MKKVDLIIPILNEEEQIGDSLKKLAEFAKDNLKDDIEYKIIVGDCGSTDKSPEIVADLMKENELFDYYNTGIYGRGRVLDHLWGTTNADYVLYMDCDLATDLSHIPEILKKLDQGCDFVIGSRNLRESKVINRSFKRTLTSKFYIFLTKLIVGTKFSDGQCGFKGGNVKSYKKIAPFVEDNSWFWDTEVLVIAEKLDMKIGEVAVKWTDDPGTTVNISKTAILDVLGLFRLKTSKIWEKIGKEVKVV